ncbi:MAG TPA: hypothetical protein VK809_08880 [Bacteroidia bacterium]|jgi:hypothetical protein|nr:hypothetical protein [Bacteroidia bacterium]
MSNQYKKKAKKKHLLGETTATSHHDKTMKESALDTAKNTPIDIGAAIGGGFVGSAIGKPSLVTGAIISGLSHFFKNKLGSMSRIGSMFGVGIMAGGFAKSSGGVSGTDDKKKSGEAAKERMKSYGEDLKQRLYLDKIPSTKKTEDKKTENKKSSTEKEETKPVNGTENFYYPETEPRSKNEMDLSALEEFQEELQVSANHHREKRKKEHEGGEVEGLNDLNPEDHNY